MTLSISSRRLSIIAKHLHPTRVSFSQAASLGNGSSRVRWLQPAGAGAKRMEDGHQKGVLHFPVCLTLGTAEPLKTEDFQKTLVHLYKKMPVLRTCFRYREGELWVCEMMEKHNIDFEEVYGDYNQELRKLIDIPYLNSDEGPLWRVRLFRGIPETPEIQILPEFPHLCTVLISLHHGMTDGNACFHIIDVLVRTLEKVIAEEAIDDGKQIGIIATDEQTLKIKREIRCHYEKHPDEVERFVRDHLQANFIPLLYQAFGFPKDPKPCTRYLVSCLETPTFMKFHEKCNEAGVTFNSGFVLAINTALVELAREAGVHKDVFHVTSRHAINLRRYWKSHKFLSFGSHVGRMPQTTETPPYNKEVFWNAVKPLDVQMREKLKNGHLLKEEVVKELKDIKVPPFEMDKPLPVDCDYFLSNAFLPFESIWSENEHARGISIQTFIEMHLCEYMTFHLVATVTGMTTYTISYSTWHITDENALRFLRKVEAIVEDLAL